MALKLSPCGDEDSTEERAKGEECSSKSMMEEDIAAKSGGSTGCEKINKKRKRTGRSKALHNG
jgi:hypothetical protein